jgi:hypothetical protein
MAATVDDGGMTKAWRRAGLVVLGLLLLGAGAFGIIADLDRADKIASVVGAVAGVIALAVASFGGSPSPSPKQSVSGSIVGGDVHQISDVDGDVEIDR